MLGTSSRGIGFWLLVVLSLAPRYLAAYLRIPHEGHSLLLAARALQQRTMDWKEPPCTLEYYFGRWRAELIIAMLGG